MPTTNNARVCTRVGSLAVLRFKALASYRGAMQHLVLALQ